MQVGHPKEFTSTGVIVAAGGPRTILKGVSLTGGSDAASAVIKEGGASGTTVLTLKAAAGATVIDPRHMEIQDPHVTLTGTGPTFTAIL